MRISIEFEVFGKTITEIVNEATKSWKEFYEVDDDRALPSDTEFHIEQHSAEEYKATVFMRVKANER
jgi:hypothetical protein